MRTETIKNGEIRRKAEFYIIEEFQSRWNRWIRITDHYLNRYKFGEFSTCGQCWQETGTEGTYELEYAKTYCNALNEALRNGSIADKIEDALVTEFRVCKVKEVYEKKPLTFTEE